MNFEVEIARLQERSIAQEKLSIEKDKQIKIAFDASEKAREKAEETQRAINVASNEWRNTFNDYSSKTPSRGEVERIREDVAEVREGHRALLERGIGSKEGSKTLQLLGVALAGAIFATLVALFVSKIFP